MNLSIDDLNENDDNDNASKYELAMTGDTERQFTSRALSKFASDGLRTLLVAYRRMSPRAASEWLKKWTQATMAVSQRRVKLRSVAELVEQRLSLLGATAIEDRLQSGVPECISDLALAGIRLWVLTGDKVETAINIARACNLITKQGLNWSFILSFACIVF